MLDFGISKQTDSETAAQHGLTRTGLVLGSPLYMSPEQMMRTKDVDPRTDIWSLGVVLYELLTGVFPVQADTIPELCAAILESPLASLSQYRNYLPEELVAVVDIDALARLNTRAIA